MGYYNDEGTWIPTAGDTPNQYGVQADPTNPWSQYLNQQGTLNLPENFYNPPALPANLPRYTDARGGGFPYFDPTTGQTTPGYQKPRPQEGLFGIGDLNTALLLSALMLAGGVTGGLLTGGPVAAEGVAGAAGASPGVAAATAPVAAETFAPAA